MSGQHRRGLAKGKRGDGEAWSGSIRLRIYTTKTTTAQTQFLGPSHRYGRWASPLRIDLRRTRLSLRPRVSPPVLLNGIHVLRSWPAQAFPPHRRHGRGGRFAIKNRAGRIILLRARALRRGSGVMFICSHFLKTLISCPSSLASTASIPTGSSKTRARKCGCGAEAASTWRRTRKAKHRCP